ncbi:MAG: SLC13 family permease [Acidobacteriota bacterium]|jgi:di/tricarboxylate transporter
MTYDLLIVLGLLALAVVLFVSERVSFDVTGLIVLCTLMATGVLSPAQGLSGLSNAATVTIAAMFVLAEGVRRTGALALVSRWFAHLGGRSPRLGMGLMMGAVAVISAFVNNTAAIAIFIPVVISVAHDMRMSPSKLLMPISFASMFGGVCTLIGTSTNILVGSIAEDHGLEPFGMFELTPLGMILLAAGLLYLFTLGVRLIPPRRTETEMAAGFSLNEYLTDVVIEPGFAQVGSRLEDLDLTGDLDLDVVQVFKGRGREAVQRSGHAVLRPGDVLRVRGSAREIDKLVRREDVSLRPAKEWIDADFERGGDTLLEAVIAPDSPLQGKTIRSVDFLGRFGAVLLAIRHHGELQQEDLGERRLSGGDSILLALDAERVRDVERDRSFVLVSRVGLPRTRRGRLPLALTILGGVVATVGLGLAPVVVAAICGAVLMILTGCLTGEEAYQAINWKVILLLAGVIPLGLAMDETGAAEMLAGWVVSVLGEWGPRAVLSGFFLLTVLLTSMVSNQATAALLAPVAIQAAEALGVAPRPFLMAVTFAASLSFMTPVGYQTNTLIYGPGQYRFTDFTRVGAPLNLILWVLATLLIPWFWGF